MLLSDVQVAHFRTEHSVVLETAQAYMQATTKEPLHTINIR